MAESIEIGIIRTSSIGDVVLASSLLNLLDKFTKETGVIVKVLWVGRNPSADLLETSYPNVSIIYSPKEKPAAEVAVRLRSCLFVLDLQVNPRSKKITKIYRSLSKRKSYEVEKFRWLRFKLVWNAFFRGRKREIPQEERKAPRKQYESNNHLLVRALLEHGLINNEHKLDELLTSYPKLSVLTPPKDRLFWNRLQEGEWIAISAGASFETKKVPKLIMTEVLQKLRDSVFDVEVPRLVFLGDRNDTEITKTIISELDWPALTLDLTGKTNLVETLAVVSKAKAVLSGDSSIPHMAEAVGVDTAVLFGPTAESFGFSPRKSSSKAYSVPLGCRPCSKHGKSSCRFEDKMCFYEINRDEVMHFLRDRLTLKEDRDIRNFTGGNN